MDGPCPSSDVARSAPASRPPPLAPEDVLRARFYELIALLLAMPPGAHLLDRVARLDGDDTELGNALADLSAAAALTTPEQLAREYHDLFIGVTRGEVVPFASYYMTGSLQGPVLADLRGELAGLGIARRAGVVEPEDAIASICEAMRALIEGAFGPPADLPAQKRFFDRYLEPWAGRFFADLEGARAARFYRPLGTLGRCFIAIETEALALVAPEAGTGQG